jgi:hypothetical protein
MRSMGMRSMVYILGEEMRQREALHDEKEKALADLGSMIRCPKAVLGSMKNECGLKQQLYQVST